MSQEIKKNLGREIRGPDQANQLPRNIHAQIPKRGRGKATNSAEIRSGILKTCCLKP